LASASTVLSVACMTTFETDYDVCAWYARLLSGCAEDLRPTSYFRMPDTGDSAETTSAFLGTVGHRIDALLGELDGLSVAIGNFTELTLDTDASVASTLPTLAPR
jgi:hypothetical protein